MRIFRICVAVLLAAAAGVAGRAAEYDEKHIFPVQPGCTLRIDTYRGEITVTESDASEVQVSVHMEIGGETDEEAQRVLRGLQLDVKEAGNVVSIFARNPRETRARWVWREDEQIGLFYRITVPRQCDVDVKNGNGDVTIGRLQGRMKVDARMGTVFFRGVEGSLEANVGEGELVISRCTGEAKARVRVGSIQTGLLGGPAELRTDSGGIEVLVARAGIQAQATAGGLTVGFPREVTHGATLRTSGGSILARLDPNSACEIDAGARWGRVRANLPVQIESGGDGKRRLRGRLNAGGPLLKLEAGGGDVSLEAGEAAFD